jgi:FlaA1/EpsC-like NDP-sugar epimerase
MLIPEAVHLVLQAASLGEQKGVYILDMGEQIRVLDLARNLIRLSGFVPGRDIAIRITGLRPGEKLQEELVGDGEVTEVSALDKIIRVHREVPLDLSTFQERELVLEAAAHVDHTDSALKQLHELVPTFRLSEVRDEKDEAAVDLSDREPLRLT